MHDVFYDLKGRQIESNYDDIKRVKDLAVACCGRVGSKLGALHGNLSALRHKVHQARDMLSTMQVVINDIEFLSQQWVVRYPRTLTFKSLYKFLGG